MDALKTSEFWSALVAAILSVLVQFKVLSPELASLAQQLSMGLVAVVIGRVVHKVANGAVPFKPVPKPEAK